YIREENPSMKKTGEGVEDGYLSRSLEVDRSGGSHIVDGYGSGHGAGSQRRRIRADIWSFDDNANGIVVKGRVMYGKHAPTCLETQGYSNTISKIKFPSIIVQPVLIILNQLFIYDCAFLSMCICRRRGAPQKQQEQEIPELKPESKLNYKL
ncbi:hypothetical protein Tco_0322408, partial [Tanacetum coccineum]